MRYECSNCNAHYAIDDKAVASSEKILKFTCAKCGQKIRFSGGTILSGGNLLLDKPAPATKKAPSPPPGSEAGQESEGGADARSFYLSMNKKGTGPFTTEEVFAQITAAKIDGTALIWSAQSDKWESLGKVEPFAAMIASGPDAPAPPKLGIANPPPAQQKSTQWVDIQSLEFSSELDDTEKFIEATPTRKLNVDDPWGSWIKK
jgi:predicted Zn finger-like uncharacterized protein